MLSTLILTNFKSYRNTTTIHFLPGFTSIIGPNGSGKSNILDAISFMLCQNVTDLRVSKQSEFISNGADSCSVTLNLIIQNNEITFERRVFIGSKSLYFFNNQSVNFSFYKEMLDFYGMVPGYFIVLQEDFVKLSHSSNLNVLIGDISGTVDVDKLDSSIVLNYLKNDKEKQKKNITDKENNDLSEITEDVNFNEENDNNIFIDKIQQKNSKIFEGMSIKEALETKKDTNIKFLEHNRDTSNDIEIRKNKIVKSECYNKQISLKLLYNDIENDYNALQTSYKSLLSQRNLLFTDLRTARDCAINSKKLKKYTKERNEIQKYIFLCHLQNHKTKIKTINDLISKFNSDKEEILTTTKQSISTNNNITQKIFASQEIKKDPNAYISKFKEYLISKQHSIIICERNLDNLHNSLKKYMLDAAESESYSEKEKNEIDAIRNIEIKLKQKNDLLLKYKNELSCLNDSYNYFLNNCKVTGTGLDESKNLFYDLESEYMKKTANKQEQLISLRIDIKPKKDMKNSLEKNLENLDKEKVNIEEDFSNVVLKISNIETEIENNKKSIQEIKNSMKSKTAENSKSNDYKKENINKKNIDLNNNNKEDDYITYMNLKKKEKELNITLTQLLYDIEELKTQTKTKKQRLIHLNTIEELSLNFNDTNETSIRKRIYGRLSDLIKPTQEKYKIPIKMLIGKYNDAVIVDSENDAIECIEWLKKFKRTRLTFLPLKSLKKKTGLKANNENGVVYGSETVHYEEIYRPVIDFVLGNSLICDTVEQAKKIKYNLKESRNTNNSNPDNEKNIYSDINKRNKIKNNMVELTTKSEKEKNIDNDINISTKSEKTLFDSKTRFENFKIATLDGILFHKNNTITGGKTFLEPENENTTQSLENLLSKKTRLMNEIKEIYFKKSKFINIEINIEKIEDLKSKTKNLSTDLNNEKQKKEFLEIKINEMEKSMENTKKQIEKVEKALNDSVIKVNELENDLGNAIRSIFGKYMFDLGNGNTGYIQSYKDLEDHSKNISKNKNYYAEKENEYEAEKKLLDRKINIIHNELKELEIEIGTRKNNLDRMKKILVENKNEESAECIKDKIEKEYEKISMMRNEYTKMKHVFDVEKNIVESGNEKIRNVEREIIRKKAEVNEVIEEVNKIFRNAEVEGIKLGVENIKIESDDKNSQTNNNQIYNIENEENKFNNTNEILNMDSDIKEKLDNNIVSNNKGEDIAKFQQKTFITENDNESNRVRKDIVKIQQKTFTTKSEKKDCENENFILEILEKINFGIIKTDVNEYIHKLNDIVKEIEIISEMKNFKNNLSSNSRKNYEKINKQYEEARKKMLETREIMNEIKRLRIERFNKCIKLINKNLSEIYNKLTSTIENELNEEDTDIKRKNNENQKESFWKNNNGTGNAYLVIENTLDPFTSKTKFFVMPPNKRYREIHNLSGGEKAMAILALIFAINKYKKATFFVLDEMDAALDKENYGRLVRYIKSETNFNEKNFDEFNHKKIENEKNDTQIIVISLKLGVFCEANALVGVYKVNEKSNVLTYKLEE